VAIAGVPLGATDTEEKEETMSDLSLPPEEKVQRFVEKSGQRDQESQAAVPPCEPARFPEGFWKGVDYLLHHHEAVVESLRRDDNLWQLSRVLFIISVVMAAIYGAAMGATNLLQGADLALSWKMLQIVVTAVKVPVLFLLTLAIVLPPVYVSNAFVGARLPFRQMLALLLASVTITVTVLASMTTVAFFFALTSRSYHFIKLLHVLFFAYAGWVGLAYLVRSLNAIMEPIERSAANRILARRTPQWLFLGWLLLYMFVGTQLAWVLRPFVGAPTEKFQVFRPRYGNLYESVYYSLDRMLQGEK
jgi:hypothetical protein